MAHDELASAYEAGATLEQRFLFFPSKHVQALHQPQLQQHVSLKP
jgi:hypothetical protein